MEKNLFSSHSGRDAMVWESANVVTIIPANVHQNLGTSLVKLHHRAELPNAAQY